VGLIHTWRIEMNSPVKPKPSSLLEYESLQSAFQAMKLARARPVPKKTREAYIGSLSVYLLFCNSKQGDETEWNLDMLLEEAREDHKNAQLKIVDFYNWQQGLEVPGFQPWTKNGKPYKVRQSTAVQRAYGKVRGFYTNNNIVFPKTFKCPQEEAPESIKADESVPFFKLDQMNGKFVLDRPLVKHFLSNLKLRDQAIALSLLSTSQDSGDLFRLTVGWAKMQIMGWERREEKGEDVARRFYWHGNRAKTGVEFKVFFSREATEFVTRYMVQERQDAEDEDPLFVTAGYSMNGEGTVQKRMAARHVGEIFREVAEKMRIHNGGKYQNPLRAKRLRHVFRTACSHAGLDEGYIHLFMGHKSSLSERYLDRPTAVLEIQYSSVEPLLTVLGAAESESLRRIEHDVIEERARRAELHDELADLRTENKTLKAKVEMLESRTERILGILEKYEKMVKSAA